jgi:hypothetical protein
MEVVRGPEAPVRVPDGGIVVSVRDDMSAMTSGHPVMCPIEAGGPLRHQVA